MSQITKQTVIKMANLARIPLTDELIEKYTLELENILSYVDELKEVDTSSVKATQIILTCKVQDLADDEPYTDQEEYTKVRNNIIKNFPKKQGNLLVLAKKII
jgi:aspartyl-tRNA(Asn)/glutamyl-tRNA(Gln) amidotransferase subunit C